MKKFNLSAYEVIESLKRDNKIVGLSTHNKEEILKANSLPLSYIGLGAYRKTSTKDTTNILGAKIIDLIKFSYHPVAVIGGVKIYDKIPANFKVIGSDICKLTFIQLKKKKIFTTIARRIELRLRIAWLLSYKLVIFLVLIFRIVPPDINAYQS